jgi:hypothetical protein
MRTLLQNLREWLCSHDFKRTRFQPLVVGTSWQCTKCGKSKHTL